MEVEFRKDLRNSYMVITQEETIRTEAYCIRLLEQQRVEGILPVEPRQMNDRRLFYYSITGMQSMSHLLTKNSLSYDRIRLIMNGILHALDAAYEFLLPVEDFILKPDFIYLDVMSYAPSICFLSGYQSELKEQMNYLLEYLMNMVDYNDKDAVLLVYQLYAACREESLTILPLYEILNREQETQTQEMVQKESRKGKVSMELKRKEQLEGSGEEMIQVKIPVMMEKLEREEEELYYPVSAYLLTAFFVIIGGLVLVLGITTGLLYNSYGHRLDYIKLTALILILLGTEGYLFRKIWNPKNRLTRIVTKSEYIDPSLDAEEDDFRPTGRLPLFSMQTQEELAVSRQSKTAVGTSADNINTEEAQEDQLREEYNPTCLLSDAGTEKNGSGVCLKPTVGSDYQMILINELPFFIGKLKSNVDYCLDRKVISRYHAKITKEENRYYITDLNSTNGTYVNGQLLTTYEKKEIRYNDEIAFANIRYTFEPDQL